MPDTQHSAMHPHHVIKSTLTGILPPLAMPFDAKGDIVYPAIAEQIDLMVDRKVRGVVVGGSTGEGHTLDREELARVMHEMPRPFGVACR
jgi:4-hydroxy-tetrahydrodipicolinate synthase